MNIGIMGGTFSPIHNGHLILSEHIRERINLDRVIFIPTGIPPHKRSTKYVLNGEIRKEMVKLAIDSNPYFSISTIEIDRGDTNYTIDTIIQLKEIYPKDKLFMIIGADSLLDLHMWKDFKKLITMVDFVVADRRGSNGTKVTNRIEELNKMFNSNIIKVDTPIIDISSTMIRENISKGLSIKYLVPESVEEYIKRNHLYR